MKNFYKILIALFVFISFIYPFRDFKVLDIDFDAYLPRSDVEAQGSVQYENMINSQIKSVLEEKGVRSAVVSSGVRLDYESNEIIVDSVQVAVGDEYDIKRVEKIIFDSMGINAKVIHIGD